MATGEKDTSVRTFIQVTYSLDGGDPDHLLRREVHRVKDETTTDFVVVMDITVDVGEKDDWRDDLQNQSYTLENHKVDMVDNLDSQIEILDEQIAEIDLL